MGASTVPCPVCGAPNPKDLAFCGSCGVKLEAADREEREEVDKLLEELAQAPKAAEGGGAEETLDLDREIVSDLLDSLLVAEGAGAEEVPPPPEETFECPLCFAVLPVDALKCTSCGAIFEEPAEVPPPPAEVAPFPEEGPSPEVAVKVSELPMPALHVLGGRFVDLVVIGTVAALVALFVVFRMYSVASITSNPSSVLVFLAVTIGGTAAGLVLLQMSNSAIAQGDRQLKAGRYVEAIELYDRAIRMGYKPAAAWTSRGVALKRVGQFEEALKCHDIALKLDPKNEIAWCNRGDVYFRMGNHDEAIASYDKAVEIRPRYAIAWNNKGAVLAREGKFAAAKECCDKAVQLRPRYVAAWLNRGEVYARLGEVAEAQKCLRRAQALGSAIPRKLPATT